MTICKIKDNGIRTYQQSMPVSYTHLMPAHYSQIPMLWRERIPRVDVFYATVSPMDKHGFFSFGLVAAETLAQLERAKYVFLEVNDQVPRVMGTHVVHISQVTAVCEASYPMRCV